MCLLYSISLLQKDHLCSTDCTGWPSSGMQDRNNQFMDNIRAPDLHAASPAICSRWRAKSIMSFSTFIVVILTILGTSICILKRYLFKSSLMQIVSCCTQFHNGYRELHTLIYLLKLLKIHSLKTVWAPCISCYISNQTKTYMTSHTEQTEHHIHSNTAYMQIFIIHTSQLGRHHQAHQWLRMCHNTAFYRTDMSMDR